MKLLMGGLTIKGQMVVKSRGDNKDISSGVDSWFTNLERDRGLSRVEVIIKTLVVVLKVDSPTLKEILGLESKQCLGIVPSTQGVHNE